MIDVPYAVKRALKDGNRPKQYRFQVLNDDETVDFTIDNNTLVKESVKIDERMCSGDRLKFGLCEGSSLEFQYFNHPNIRGRRVKVFLDVAYDNEGTEAYYPLSMGYFDVDQCSTQFSTGIIKAVAYNKLRSDYLDQKCNDAIVEAAEEGNPGISGGTSIGTLLQKTLEGYSVEPDFTIYDFSNISTFESGCLYPMPIYEKRQDGTYSQLVIDNKYQYMWPYRVYFTLLIPDYDLSVARNDYERISAELSKIYNIITGLYEISSAYGYYFRDRDGTYKPILDYDGDHYTQADSPYPDMIQICNHISGASNPSIYIEYIRQYKSQDQYQTPYCFIENALSVNITFYCAWLIDYRSDFRGDYNAVMIAHATEIENATQVMSNAIFGGEEKKINCESRNDTYMEQITFTTAEAKTLPDVTLRELQSAVYETACQYGQLNRDTDLFYGVELNSGGLYPVDSLYPADSLYPNQGYPNNLFRPFPSEYQKLWTDSVGEQTFRYLIITYKAIEYDQQGNPTEVDKTLQRTVHEHGTTNYNCSDNWLFRNLVWTAEQVGAYADAMVEKMLNIRWFPFEMWSTGLPYVEVGDAIEIADKEGDTHISYVLQRQLNGVQNLQDTYINGQLDIF